MEPMTIGLGRLNEATTAAFAEAATRLATALEGMAPPPPLDLPPGVRQDINRLAALLNLSTWEEVLRIGFQVDMRDLVEAELIYLERVTPSTVRKWRQDGTGPAYRHEAGIRYPVREVWEWRRKGRQIMTSQKAARRGRRSSP